MGLESENVGDIAAESDQRTRADSTVSISFEGIFDLHDTDDCISVSENSIDSRGPSLSASRTSYRADAAEHRRCAIERWRLKRSRRRGLVKVCKARSDVALSRPRVKGKFVKKTQFIAVTELQS